MGDGVSMEKIRNLSLKKTMVLYTILSLIVTFFLSVSIIEIAGQIQEEVWWKYVDQDEYYQAMNDRNENFEVVVPRPNQSKMSRMDWHISETCDFLQTYGVLLFSFAGCGIAVSLFYKNKLKRPIQELKMASQMIAEEDLDFHMAYENEDEMGMLCREFESGKVLLDGTLYCEANYEKIQKKIGYLPQEIDLYPSLTVRECLEYMGDLAGIEKRESKKRIDYYLEKTSLADHQKKKMRQLSGGMKRRVGLVQALLHEPDFLIVDEPTTGLDPEERIRIRNLLVDFAEERTVLFSTHVVEDLMATCNQLAVMKKGRFLYTGTMRELLNKARGHVWECCTEDESLARELERKYHISSKQYTEEGIRLRLLGENMPSESGCIACDVTLEDAYIYVTNR